MSLIRINRNPPPRQLLVFAVAWGVLLALAGWETWHRGRHGSAALLWALALAVPMGGAVNRKVLLYAYRGLSYLSYPIGLIVSQIVLAVVYFLVLTPIGLILRLLGKDPLGPKLDPGRKTYWTPRENPKTVESYFKQR